MPITFDKLGIRFDYPDNWSLDEEWDDQQQHVVVSSPETAFWQLSKHPPTAELEAIFDEALAAIRSEYKEMEAEAVREEFEDSELEGYNVNFYCLDFTNTAWLRALRTPDATYLVLCQAEDREFESTGQVFMAMLASMLRYLQEEAA